MNATLLCLRHDSVPEKWSFVDGEDVIHVWIDPDGIKTQRMSARSSGSGYISHDPQTLRFHQVIDMSERQLSLLGNLPT